MKSRPREEGAGSPDVPARRRRGLWPWAPPVAYMALIFGLSSLRNPLPAVTERVWDKALHAVEYGVLGALLAFALRASGAGRARSLLLGAFLASLYGASDELHQAFVPNRSCDVRDWVADTLGAVLGAWGWALALRVNRLRASIRPAQRRT